MTTRTSGKNSAFMVDTSSAANGSAVLVANLRGFDVDESRSEIDLTCSGDDHAVSDLGIAASKATVKLVYAMGSPVIGQICDGAERVFYGYPNKVASPNVYWYGTGRMSCSSTVPYDGAVEATLAMVCTALNRGNI